MAYSFRRDITIDRDLVGLDNSGTLPSSGFPVLIQLSDNTLRSVSNGGNVESVLGYDIIFKTAGGASLYHELEGYDPVNGQIVAWVRIDSLSKSTDTVIRIWYGDDTVGSPTEDPTNVWDSDYSAVYHLSGDSDDSTTVNDGTETGISSATGKIANCREWDGSTSYVDVGSDSSIDNIFAGGGTIEAWIDPDGWGEANEGFIFGKVSTRFMIRSSSSSIRLLRTRSGTDGEWEADTTISLTGGWYHVVVVYDEDSASNDPTFYINGTASTETELFGPPTGTATSDAGSTAYLGNYSSSATRTFDGPMDEIRLSTTERDGDWVRTCWNNQDDPGDIGDSGFYAVGSEVSAIKDVVANMTATADFATVLESERGIVINMTATADFATVSDIGRGLVTGMTATADFQVASKILRPIVIALQADADFDLDLSLLLDLITSMTATADFTMVLDATRPIATDMMATADFTTTCSRGAGMVSALQADADFQSPLDVLRPIVVAMQVDADFAAALFMAERTFRAALLADADFAAVMARGAGLDVDLDGAADFGAALEALRPIATAVDVTGDFQGQLDVLRPIAAALQANADFGEALSLLLGYVSPFDSLADFASAIKASRTISMSASMDAEFGALIGRIQPIVVDFDATADFVMLLVAGMEFMVAFDATADFASRIFTDRLPGSEDAFEPLDGHDRAFEPLEGHLKSFTVL